MEICVTEPDILKKVFFAPEMGKMAIIGFFEFIGKFGH